MQVCTCAKCLYRRKIKAERKCRFVDTKEYSCLVEKVEEDDDLNELSYYNSTWLIGTGKSVKSCFLGIQTDGSQPSTQPSINQK